MFQDPKEPGITFEFWKMLHPFNPRSEVLGWVPFISKRHLDMPLLKKMTILYKGVLTFLFIGITHNPVLAVSGSHCTLMARWFNFGPFITKAFSNFVLHSMYPTVITFESSTHLVSLKALGTECWERGREKQRDTRGGKGREGRRVGGESKGEEKKKLKSKNFQVQSTAFKTIQTRSKFFSETYSWINCLTHFSLFSKKGTEWMGCPREGRGKNS